MGNSVGIVGFGKFGRFLAEKLSPFAEVSVYSRRGGAGAWTADLAKVAAADYVILTVPLESYEELLNNLKPHLSPSSVIVDVCSVKVIPVEIIKSILPGQRMVATHPLFGPESAAERLHGHALVVCPEDSDKDASLDLETFAQLLGLNVIKMSAAEHDEEIALVQGLTFFIAHALKDMNLHDQKLSTPSFKKLLQLTELEKHHSFELFKTIQAGNENTEAIRKSFIKVCQKLDGELNGSQV